MSIEITGNGESPLKPDPSPDFFSQPISRRGFGLSSLALFVLFETACNGQGPPKTSAEPTATPEPRTVPELQRYGREIENWILGGKKMGPLFPDIKKAADLLLGRVNPRTFIPQLELPIGYQQRDSKGASFAATFNNDDNDPRKIAIKLPSGEIVVVPWLQSVPASFKMEPDVENSSVRIPIMIKEASQLYDIQEYAKLYLDLVEQVGVTANFLNPTNIQTSEGEMRIASVNALRILEEQRSGGTSFFINLVDVGSIIKVGGIMFTNWYLDLLN